MEMMLNKPEENRVENGENPLLAPYQYEEEFEERIKKDPRQLNLLLIETAVIKAETARMAHKAGRMAEKGFHLGRITAILDALRDRLDRKNYPEIAQEYETYYTYIDHCIQDAVYEEDKTEILDLALFMLMDLRDMWRNSFQPEQAAA